MSIDDLLLNGFISELDRTGLASTEYAHTSRIIVPADARTAVAACAARHGLEVNTSRRYTSWLREGIGGLRLVCSQRPRAHVALALAHVLADWDQHLAAGEPAGFSWESTPPTGVADMAARMDTDLYIQAGVIQQKLAWAIDDWLTMGPYGSDPEPADLAEHTLASLIADHLTLDMYHNGSTLTIAAEEGLRAAHLVRSAHLLAADRPVQLAARPTAQAPGVTR